MKLFSKDQPKSRTLLAITSNPMLSETVDEVSKKLPNVSTTVKQTENTIVEIGRLVNGSADVVIVEADMADPNSLEALRRLATYVSAYGSLIVITRNGSSTSTRQLFRAGAADVLEMVVSADELLSSVNSLLSAPRRSIRPTKSGRVISVQNCGGGAGATTIAANLAHNFAHRKKTITDAAPQILLVDMDPQFGNIATVLNQSGKTSLLDLIQGGERFDASFLNSVTQSIEPNLELVAAPKEILPLSALNKAFCDRFLDAACQTYDYIILDLPQNWGAQTQPLLSRSDAILSVMRPCLEHTERAQAVLQGLDDISVERDRVLTVINQTQGLAHSDRIKRITEVLKRPHCNIPYDEKVHKLAREQGRFLADVSRSKSQVKAITKLSDKTLEIINTAVFDKNNEGTSSASVEDNQVGI